MFQTLFELQSNGDQSQRMMAVAQNQVEVQGGGGGDQKLHTLEGYSYDHFRRVTRQILSHCSGLLCHTLNLFTSGRGKKNTGI